MAGMAVIVIIAVVVIIACNVACHYDASTYQEGEDK